MASQHGASFPPIVGDLSGLRFYRGNYVTWKKQHAHRSHRHRVKADLRTLVDPEELEDTPRRSEQCDAWDIW